MATHAEFHRLQAVGLLGAGEYVSVSSQSDTENADVAREREEVAKALTAHDALGAHARDELGLHPGAEAEPIQAALASAVAFAVGAAPPVAIAALVALESISTMVVASTLVSLVGLGAVAARLGGAPMVRGAARVAFWGAVAMGGTALVGRLFGAMVG